MWRRGGNKIKKIRDWKGQGGRHGLISLGKRTKIA